MACLAPARSTEASSCNNDAGDIAKDFTGIGRGDLSEDGPVYTDLTAIGDDGTVFGHTIDYFQIALVNENRAANRDFQTGEGLGIVDRGGSKFFTAEHANARSDIGEIGLFWKCFTGFSDGIDILIDHLHGTVEHDAILCAFGEAPREVENIQFVTMQGLQLALQEIRHELS